MLILLAHHHLGCFTFVITTTLVGVNHATHLYVLFSQCFVFLFQLAHDCLEMESVMVCGVFALSKAYEPLNFIHFCQKFLVLSVNKVDLSLLTDYLVFGGFLVEILTDTSVALLICGDHLQTADLLVT